MNGTTRLYNEYIRSDEWADFRRKVIEKYVGCLVCGKTKNLHVHHRHYRTLKIESFGDIALLCREHHRKLHNVARTQHRTYDEALERVIERFGKPSRRIRKKKRKSRTVRAISASQRIANALDLKKRVSEERKSERKRAKELREQRIALWGMGGNTKL